ncbi:MAG: hypothetical protein JEZ12_12875 [Desulfobacterium sp.]|nr:hypothetical protein [Desulfobacterium sp.]
MAQEASAFLNPDPDLGLDFDLSGYVETRHCFQAKSPNDFLASETLARVEGRASTADISLFASVDLSANYRFGDESGVSIHEAYVDYVSSPWDLRAGRQIITWGNADGVRVTDNISPSDLSEYITRDFDEIRMAVDALKFRLFGTHGTAELIYIPFFKAGILPEDDSPWAVGGFSSTDTMTRSSGDAEPGKGLENGEFGAKYAFFLPGFDFALSYFYTWNDLPDYAFTRKAGEFSDAYLVTPEFNRLHITGVEFSKPYGDFVFRGEAAFFHGRRYSARDRDSLLQKKDQAKWLLGVDWYPGSNWSLLCQVTGDRILGFSDTIAREKHTTMVTFNLSRKLLREKLILSGMHYYTMDAGDSLTRLSGEYAVMDGFSLFLGSDIFTGDREGTFGRYRDNTQVWVKAKYSF